ncbi:hypothetical protein MCAG_02162 [Micromonospora sp. ATCC 39149]|nr:hypothetical protein MCAG_02162 [Micromonospora sp. ATCC 39149]
MRTSRSLPLVAGAGAGPAPVAGRRLAGRVGGRDVLGDRTEPERPGSGGPDLGRVDGRGG